MVTEISELEPEDGTSPSPGTKGEADAVTTGLRPMAPMAQPSPSLTGKLRCAHWKPGKMNHAENTQFHKTIKSQIQRYNSSKQSKYSDGMKENLLTRNSTSRKCIFEMKVK